MKCVTVANVRGKVQVIKKPSAMAHLPFFSLPEIGVVVTLTHSFSAGVSREYLIYQRLT